MNSPAQTAKALIGQVIADRYRVDALLGVGGMGTVFRCHHLALERDVAVKLLHPELLENEQIAVRFEREARSTSKLEHPNVLQVLDFGTWSPPGSQGGKGDAKFMVLQLLTGDELTEQVEGPLPLERALSYSVQIARGLEHAHSRGIVHRDLKPENVFVTKDHNGQDLLKILDFGLARMLSESGDEQRLTRTGMVFGTPQYMSPEQATGADTDERTDIYALGIMIWEMLAGHPPFDGDDVIAVIRKQVSCELPNQELPATTPPALVALLGEMTAKRADERLSSTKAVRERLEAMLGYAPASASMSAAHLGAGPSAHLAGGPSLLQPGMPSLAPLGTADSHPMAPLNSATAPATSAVAKVGRTTIIASAHDAGVRLAGRFAVPPKVVFAAVGGAAFIVVVTLAMALTPDAKPQEAPPPVASGGGLDLPFSLDSVEPVSRASAVELASVDEAMEKHNDATALAKLDELMITHPKDAQLHLRRALVLGRQEGKHAPALKSFGEAFELDPALARSEDNYRALLELLRDPKLTAESVEFVIKYLGERGHPILRDFVNRENAILSFVDRHRVLSTLESNSDESALVDMRLNNALDLWQAQTTARPCEVFSLSLKKIEQDPHAGYVGTLQYVRAPKESTKEGAKDCSGLEEERVRIATMMSERFPEADKAREVPEQFEAEAGKRKKKKGRKRFRLFQ